MTVTCAVVDALSISSGTSTSHFCPAFSAAGNLCVLAFQHSQAAASVGDISSITNGPFTAPTKRATVPFNNHAAPKQKVELWYATTLAGTGTYDITFPAAVSQMRLQILEFAHVDMTKGASGILQAATQFSDVQSAMACNMAPLLNGGSAVFAIFGGNGNGATTPKTGWSEIFDSQLQVNQPLQDFEGQFRANTTDNAPQGDNLSNTAWGAIAIELAGTGGPVAMAGKANIATGAKQGVVLRYR